MEDLVGVVKLRVLGEGGDAQSLTALAIGDGKIDCSHRALAGESKNGVYSANYHHKFDFIGSPPV